MVLLWKNVLVLLLSYPGNFFLSLEQRGCIKLSFVHELLIPQEPSRVSGLQLSSVFIQGDKNILSRDFSSNSGVDSALMSLSQCALTGNDSIWACKRSPHTS